MKKIETLSEEQLIQQILSRGTENIIPSSALLTTLLQSKKKLRVYLGVDPTATHIHLGHAVPLRKLNQFAQLGHDVYFLIGDFTATIGDTSDKNTERPRLSSEEIEQNFQTYKEQASKVVDFSKVKVVHNSEWLKDLNFSKVLELTSEFSLNDFISRELIRERLQKGNHISLSEALYPIMQGYDSFHLDTDIQLGGTDQTFNMQAGRTLIRKRREKESFIIANGFLTGTDGRKMSKSWGNAIWLDDSPEDMFGKVMSIKDELIPEYFRLATYLSEDEISTHLDSLKTGTQVMELKKQLAFCIVSELYSDQIAAHAQEFFASTIQKKEAPRDIDVITIDKPTITIERLIEELCSLNIIPSKTEGRRLHQQGSLYYNDEHVDAQAQEIVFASEENIIRIGKRRYVRFQIKKQG